MSAEEEIELRDLVAQTLETNGCLAKLRAQLRASIFLALDEDVKISKQQPLLNNKVKTHLETEEGRVMFCVVREFLEFFNLYFTLSVFDPESYMGTGYNYEGREKVAEDLRLDNVQETTVPLLLQLIKIAQTKTKNLEINLNITTDDREENKSTTHDNSTSNLIKTDSDNISSCEANTNLENDKLLIEHFSPAPEKLNATFDLSSPTVNFNIIKKTETSIKIQTAQLDHSKDHTLDSTYSKRDEKDDDTFGDTSSIAEDSVALINLENITVPELNLNGLGEYSLINDHVNKTELSQPTVKESNTTDKLKLSPQKSEKLKSKTNLSSLSDLPPLQMNKSRVNDILPSLYSKEFKDKSNLRELDKLFDMEAEYEEDFICSGDDLSLKSDYRKLDEPKTNLLVDLQLPSKTISPDKSVFSKRDLKQKVPKIINSDTNKQLLKPLVSSSKPKDTFKGIDTENKSEGSNSSSVNENLVYNNTDLV